MQHIDPNDNSTQRQTDQLLEKSKQLKERTKATSEKLNKLKEESDKIRNEKMTFNSKLELKR